MTIADYLRRHAKPPVWEVVMSIIGLLVVLSIWQWLRVHEQDHVQRWCQLAADTVQSDLVADLHGKVLSDAGMGLMWQGANEPTEAEWQAAAQYYLRRHPGAMSMQWVSTAYQPRWSASLDGAASPPVGEGDWQRVLASVARTREVGITRTFRALDDTSFNVVVAPILKNEALQGFTVITFNTRHLLQDLLQDVSALGYSLVVTDDAGKEIFSPGASSAKSIASSDFLLPDVGWHVRVAPTTSTADTLRSYLPSTFLALGIVVCLSVTVLLRLAGLARSECELANQATLNLATSQTRLASILDISPEAIISLNEKQEVTLFNKGAEHIFGYRAAEMIGKPLNVLIPPKLRQAHDRHVQDFEAAPHSMMKMSERNPVLGIRADGTEFPAEASVSKLDLEGERIFTVCVRDVTERIKIAQALQQAHQDLEKRVQQRTSELRAVNQSLRDLSGRVLVLQDQERRRIARDLHDSTAQNLLLLAVNLSHMEKAGVMPEQFDEVLKQCIGLTDLCTSEIRTISYLLHPPMLEEFGLVPALRWYIDGFGKRSGVRITLELDPDLGRLPGEVELTIFRIVQECLTNVHRHSESRTAGIALKRSVEEVTLAVSDEGCGIPVELLAQAPADGMVAVGVGIAGMRERLGHIGGRLEIQSSDRGTVMKAIVPLSENSEIPSEFNSVTQLFS